tara:strand:+ start:741 stop:2372 length:1632 start_codon:yes stop_codon:yes gene_type:complete
MKKKFNYFFLIIFLSFIYTGNSIAKPRCEELHENVYNDLIRTDVNLYFHQKKKTIGIRLLKVPDKNKKDFVLSKNKDGYFKVGKITKGELSKLIFIDDVILSINDKDIRKIITDPKKIESMVEEISDFFDEDELIKFEILRFDYEKNNFSKIIIDRTQGSAEPNIYNTLETFNEHMSDIYINSINVNEKEGNFDASIETDFYQKLDDRYTLTNKIWESLVYDKKFDDDNKLEDFWWESCTYDDEKWQMLNTADPTYGVYFDNLIKEERQMRFSEFYIQPLWDFKLKENPKDEFDTFLLNDGAQLSYKSKSVYKIKNAFNLKNFPFDKQSLRIFLRQDQNTIDEDRFLVSSWTMRKAEEFKDQNSIQGWNITDVQMNYKVYDHTLKDGFYDGFELVFNIERKSRYYVYKIILPIILILIVCWSAVWIKPYEIESRLTITIVCLLSLIAYNFVIDADLPKLEYLTVMDYIILTSYVYSTIPTFLSILSHNSIGTKNKKIIRIELLSKTYGLLSYIVLILLILIISSSNLPQHTSSALSWASLGAN